MDTVTYAYQAVLDGRGRCIGWINLVYCNETGRRLGSFFSQIKHGVDPSKARNHGLNYNYMRGLPLA